MGAPEEVEKRPSRCLGLVGLFLPLLLALGDLIQIFFFEHRESLGW